MKIAIAMLLFAMFPVCGVQADSLGRLFFTPEQRTQLEYEHARNTTSEGGSSSVATVNGIVQQHGGARTVWINGTAHKTGHGGDSITEAVAVPGKSQPVQIKVGEKLLLEFSQAAAPQSSPAPSE